MPFILSEMNIDLVSLLTDNGIKYVKLFLLMDTIKLPEIDWINLNYSLWSKFQEFFATAAIPPEDKKTISKGEILARYDEFGSGVFSKSYILVDYWVESGGRKYPVIKYADISKEFLFNIDRRQLAALLTIDTYDARLRFINDDIHFLEQYLNLETGLQVTIRDPNTNGTCSGIISKSEFIDFKFYYFLKSKSSFDEIRFGIESFVKLDYMKGTASQQKNATKQQQEKIYSQCQPSSKKNVANVAPNLTRSPINSNPLRPIPDSYQNSDHQPSTKTQPDFSHRSSPNPDHNITTPPINQTLPLKDSHQFQYNRDKNVATVSDAVPLNDLGPERPNSHGVVPNCLVKVKLKHGINYGSVVWTGVFEGVPNHVWVLIETDEIQEDCTSEEKNGFKYGVKIAIVKPGHGLFVPAERCEILTPDDIECNKLPRSSLIGSPNEYDPCSATIVANEFVPPIKDLSKILGLKKGIQGLDNSCYMDASLFGMFCFNARVDDIFLKKTAEQVGRKDSSAERYTVVQKILKERIVYPLRKEGFVRADQILLLRHKLDEAGVMDGLVDREKDPEEFLTCLLQHVLKVQPYLKIRGTRNEDGFFFQIFTHRRPHINLPTVQLLLEHAFREGKLILAEVPQFFLIQMPRDGKHFRLYPNIVPSLTLDISNITQSVYSPKCVLCRKPASFRCEQCEVDELYDAKNVFIHYCLNCSEHHKGQVNHKQTELDYKHKQRQDSSTQMKLFAILTIEVAHYVCFAKCGANPRDWVMFDSMHDRIEDGRSSRNVPSVVQLPDFEEWLTNPDKLCKVSDLDAKKTVPEYIRRLTRDVYVCMYYSEGNEMF